MVLLVRVPGGLERVGVTFKAGVNVGKDMAYSDVVEANDAVLMAVGATWPRDLPIPGRKESKGGIHFAMEFLQTWQQKQRGMNAHFPCSCRLFPHFSIVSSGDEVDSDAISARGLDVVVIGGGDTGCDCIGTSLRQGAKSITTFEILPQPPENRAKDNPWPQFPRLFKVS